MVGVLVHFIVPVVSLFLFCHLQCIFVYDLVDFLHVVGEALQEHPSELGVVLHHALADMFAHCQQVGHQGCAKLGFGA